jgi:hypothetical protein
MHSKLYFLKMMIKLYIVINNKCRVLYLFHIFVRNFSGFKDPSGQLAPKIAKRDSRREKQAGQP